MVQVTLVYTIQATNTGTPHDLNCGCSLLNPTTGEELYPLPWWVIFNVPTGGQYNVEINATGDVTPGTYQAKARAWTDYNAGTKASDLVDSSGNIVGALYNGGTGSVNPPILDEAVQTIVIGQAVVSATIDNFTITI